MNSIPFCRFVRAALVVSLICVGAFAAVAEDAAAPTTAWFQSTEQSLMDAVANGNKAVWESALDDGCIYTSEEGQLLTKKELLAEMGGLPPGLTGQIKVEEVTVQQFPTTAIVRFLANESEDVFGQSLHTRYRVTDVFQKEDSDWKIVSSHLSVVTTDPPAQDVSKKDWAQLQGVYKLIPNGWELQVALRDGNLWAGRSADNMKLLIPLGPNVFVRKGALGELIFITDEKGGASKIVDYRKFQPLIWTKQ